MSIAAERAALQQTAGDVVEPEALAHFVEFLGRFHISSLSPVIDFEQDYDWGNVGHSETAERFGLCQQPSAAIRASASFGPQLPRL